MGESGSWAADLDPARADIARRQVDLTQIRFETLQDLDGALDPGNHLRIYALGAEFPVVADG